MAPVQSTQWYPVPSESSFKNAFASGYKVTINSTCAPISIAPGTSESVEFPITKIARNIIPGTLSVPPPSGSSPSNFFRVVQTGLYTIIFNAGPSTVDQNTVVYEFFKNDQVFYRMSDVQAPSTNETFVGEYIPMQTILHLNQGDIVYAQMKNLSTTTSATGVQYTAPPGVPNKTFTIIRLV